MQGSMVRARVNLYATGESIYRMQPRSARCNVAPS